MKRLLFGGLAVAAVVAAAVLLVMSSVGNQAQASGGSGNNPHIMGLDVSPDANNTATSLGTIQQCIRVNHVVGGTNFNVDSFMDDIPNGKDLAGFNYFLNFNNAYLKLPAAGSCKVAQNYLLGSNPASSVMNSGDACPNASGALGVVAADTAGAAGAEAAKALGVLERYGFQTIAAGPVCVGLTISDIVVGDSGGGEWWSSDGDQVWDYAYTPKYGMVCIDKDCPTPADLQDLGAGPVWGTLSPAKLGIDNDGDLLIDEDWRDGVDNDGDCVGTPPVWPATACSTSGGVDEDLADFNISQDYSINFVDALQNNGPMTPVSVTVTVEGTVPAGIDFSFHCAGGEKVEVTGDPTIDPCSAGTTVWAHAGESFKATIIVNNVAITPPAAPTQVTRTLDWHCLEPSTHVFNLTKKIFATDPTIPDPNTANNDLVVPIAINCIGYADVAEGTYTNTTKPPGSSVVPPALAGYPAIVHSTTGAGNATGTLGMTKTLTLTGYGPVTVDANESAAVAAYTGMKPANGDCTIAPAGYSHLNVILPVGSTTRPEKLYTLTCNRGGIGKDDDVPGDGKIDEDPINGVNDDGDAATDEDSPFYFVTLAFSDVVGYPKEAHVLDPDHTNNGPKTTLVTVLVIRPFVPAYSSFATSIGADNLTKPDPGKLCFASPAFGCKTQSHLQVPWDLTLTWPQSQPIAGIASILGDAPGDFIQIPGPSMPLGALIGAFDFRTDISPGGGAECNLMIAGSGVPFGNACLPPSGYVSPYGVPWPAGYVPDSRCAVNTPTQVNALAPEYAPWGVGTGAAFSSWSSSLDTNVFAVQTKFGGGKLVARYSGIEKTTNTQVNILIFDMSSLGFGPWMTWSVTSDPMGVAVFRCPEYLVDTTTMGSTTKDYWGATIASQMIKYCNVVAPPATPHAVTGLLIRTDLGTSSYKFDTLACALPDVSVTLTKDERVGEAPPVGDVAYPGITNTQTVTFNTTGPPDVTVQAQLIGPLSCNPRWVGGDARTVGGMQISTLNLGVVGAGTTTRNYTFKCATAGTYSFQITANADSVAIPYATDPNQLNNLAENHPVIIVTNNNDVDNDTIANAVDNCPLVANPDQKDTDGDGIGDACDPDIDGDGILNTPDQCPLVAEDIDEEDDADGCPDSDAHGIVVDKNHDIDVDVSVNHVETVTTTIINGNYGLWGANGMQFIELLKSDVSNPNNKCEARWIPLPGDKYVEDVIAGELWSQLEVVVHNVPPYNDASKTRQYVVHCNARSNHSVFLEEAAYPVWPVIDPNTTNGNIHKQYITIEAWDKADLKEVSFDVHSMGQGLYVPGMDIPVNTTVGFLLKKVIHNNGPAGPQQTDWVAIDYTITAPQDCTILGITDTPAAVTLPPVSVDTVIWDDGTIKCLQPSTHTITIKNDISVTGTHIVDPNPANNSRTTTMVVDVVATADLKSDGCGIEGLPASINASQTVDVGLAAYVSTTNPGDFVPVSATLTANFVVPADCTLTPSSINTQRTWTALGPNGVVVPAKLHCANQSTHAITCSTAVSAPKAPHVSDPVMTNNTGTGSASVAVLAVADVKVKSFGITAADELPGIAGKQILVQPGVDEVIQTSEVIHNNGTFGPVHVNVTKTASTDVPTRCLFTPATVSETADLVVSADLADSESWTVSFTSYPVHTGPYACTVDLSKSLAVNQTHVSDPTPGNNSLGASVVLVLDTDADTVPDGYSGLRDNCRYTANPGQQDSDGDGLGDACDVEKKAEVKNCLKFGPAPVNLSDSQGRYMWVICEIGNTNSVSEDVVIDLNVTGVPQSCLVPVQQLILPGLDHFVMTAGEQKWVLYRERYECHAPGTEDVYPLNVEFCVSLTAPFFDDDDGDTVGDEDPVDAIDNDGDTKVDEDVPELTPPTDCHQQTKLLVVGPQWAP